MFQMGQIQEDLFFVSVGFVEGKEWNWIGRCRSGNKGEFQERSCISETYCRDRTKRSETKLKQSLR